MTTFPIPADAGAITERTLAVLGIEPQNNLETGRQRTDRDGVPMWNLSVVYVPNFGPKQVIDIGFAADHPPEIIPGEPPVFTNLTCQPGAKVNEYGKLRTWAMWRCDNVRFATTRPTASDRNSAAAAV